MNLFHRGIVSLALGFSLMSAAAQEMQKTIGSLSVPFKLESDGRACSGFLRVTGKELIWKSSWSTCRGEWLAKADGSRWIVTLTNQFQENNCRIHVIEMKHPKDMEDLWSVAGYASLNDLQQHPTLPILACVMQ
jgi:hypothetical protein